LLFPSAAYNVWIFRTWCSAARGLRRALCSVDKMSRQTDRQNSFILAKLKGGSRVCFRLSGSRGGLGPRKNAGMRYVLCLPRICVRVCVCGCMFLVTGSCKIWSRGIVPRVLCWQFEKLPSLYTNYVKTDSDGVEQRSARLDHRARNRAAMMLLKV
jgi:hypothetical protein